MVEQGEFINRFSCFKYFYWKYFLSLYIQVKKLNNSYKYTDIFVNNWSILGKSASMVMNKSNKWIEQKVFASQHPNMPQLVWKQSG